MEKMKVSRREEVVLNRLRAGHTYLTQAYLMEGGVQVPPICHFCDDAIQTVKHLLLQCPALDGERRQWNVFRQSNEVTMKEVLNKPEHVKEIMIMLKRLRVFSAV